MSRLILPLAVFIASSSLALAEPAKMTDTQLDTVVAGHLNGGGNPCGIHVECANNGWGNGLDLTNPGSFHGGTEPSKSTNMSIPGGGINENPTTSTGR